MILVCEAVGGIFGGEGGGGEKEEEMRRTAVQGVFIQHCVLEPLGHCSDRCNVVDLVLFMFTTITLHTSILSLASHSLTHSLTHSLPSVYKNPLL